MTAPTIWAANVSFGDLGGQTYGIRDAGRPDSALTLLPQLEGDLAET